MKRTLLIVILAFFLFASPALAANSITSRTSPCAAGVVTHPIDNKKEGAFILLKYTKGDSSSVTVTPTYIFPDLSGTDQYAPLLINSSTPTAQIYTFTASGKYQIPIGIADGAKTLKLTITLPDGTTAVVVCDVFGQ
jgi:hypothetical protein